MKIVREKASQRRHHRLTAPLNVFYKEKKYKVRDWSIGGIGLYINRAEELRIGGKFTIKISLPFQGYDIQFDADIRVVRFDKKARLAGLEFVDLPQRSSDLLAYFSEDLIRGHMGTFEDSICRIDIPVTPISTQPTTSHISETPIRRLPFKTIFMTLVYVFFGMAIFGYLGLLLYSNFFRLEVKTSVISTEMRTFKMPVDGVVNTAHLKIGAQFELGQKLFSYEDISLEKEIIVANREVKQAQKKLWRAQKRHQIENERMSRYQVISSADKDIVEAKLSTLRVALAADLDLLAIDIEMAYSQLEAEIDKLDILLSYKSKTIMTAPFPGRVTKIYQSSIGNAVKDEPIILFERSDQIFVTAYLNQQEILQIGLNDIAKIYIPAIDKNITAIVTRIDRKSLLLNKSSTHYVWRDVKTRSGTVHLWLNMDSPQEIGIRTGMPVVTIFTRKSTSELWSTLSRILSSNSSIVNVRENEKN